MKRYIDYFNQTYPTHDLEEVLRGLREMGAFQIDTIRVLLSELKLSLSEADEIVLNSETWKDMKEDTIQLRDDIWDALNSLEE